MDGRKPILCHNNTSQKNLCGGFMNEHYMVVIQQIVLTENTQKSVNSFGYSHYLSRLFAWIVQNRKWKVVHIAAWQQQNLQPPRKQREQMQVKISNFNLSVKKLSRGQPMEPEIYASSQFQRSEWAQNDRNANSSLREKLHYKKTNKNRISNTVETAPRNTCANGILSNNSN